MKKRTRQRWGKVGYCFLTAAFIVGFLWAHKALMLAEQEQLFLNGYVTCVKHGEQLKAPLYDKMSIAPPQQAKPIGEPWPMNEYL